MFGFDLLDVGTLDVDFAACRCGTCVAMYSVELLMADVNQGYDVAMMMPISLNFYVRKRRKQYYRVSFGFVIR